MKYTTERCYFSYSVINDCRARKEVVTPNLCAYSVEKRTGDFDE
jgi:hypothetical protein